MSDNGYYGPVSDDVIEKPVPAHDRLNEAFRRLGSMRDKIRDALIASEPFLVLFTTKNDRITYSLPVAPVPPQWMAEALVSAVQNFDVKEAAGASMKGSAGPVPISAALDPMKFIEIYWSDCIIQTNLKQTPKDGELFLKVMAYFHKYYEDQYERSQPRGSA